MGWLAGWGYRKSHQTTGDSETDYHIRIKVHYGSGTDSDEDVYCSSKCRTDFADLRFARSDGTTLLPHWLERKVDSDYAIFWVKLNSTPGDPALYVYYGKSDAASASSASNTFWGLDISFESTTGWTEVDPHGVLEIDITTDKRAEYTNAYNTGTYIYGQLSAALANFVIDWTQNHAVGSASGGSYPNEVSQFFYLADSAGAAPRTNDVECMHNCYPHVDFNTHVGGTEYQARYWGLPGGTTYYWRMEKLSNTSGRLRAWTNIDRTGDPVFTSTLSNMPTVSLDYLHVVHPRESYAGGRMTGWVDDIIVRKYTATFGHGTWGPQEPLTITDAFSLADAVSTQETYHRTLTDPYALADIAIVLRAKLVALLDAFALADLIAALWARRLVVADPYALSDITSTRETYYRTLTSAFTLADAALTQETYFRTLTDTHTLADALATIRARRLAVEDPHALADVTSTREAYYRTLTDAYGLGDIFSALRSRRLIIADGHLLADALATIRARRLAVEDSHALADATSTQEAYYRALSDAYTLADPAATLLARRMVLADALAMADTLSRSETYYRALADAYYHADSLRTRETYYRALADAYRLADMPAVRRNPVLLAKLLLKLIRLVDLEGGF